MKRAHNHIPIAIAGIGAIALIVFLMGVAVSQDVAAPAKTLNPRLGSNPFVDEADTSDPFGSDPADTPSAPAPGPATPLGPGPGVFSSGFGYAAPPEAAPTELTYAADRRFVQQGIRAYSAWLKQAETDEHKARAKQRLKSIIEKTFDRDMARREREIAAIEARVNKLRDKFDERRDAKDEIVDLQVKVIEYEAKGLGLFNAPRGSANTGSTDPFNNLGSDDSDPFN